MNLIILFDTHGLLRPAVLEYLQSADAILHAGDINSQAVVNKLASFAPLCGAGQQRQRLGRRPSPRGAVMEPRLTFPL